MSTEEPKGDQELEADEEKKIHITVDFLTDVHERDEVYKRGYKEADLRKYLMNKRGLTSDQVDEAFRIHKQRLKQSHPDSLPGPVVPPSDSKEHYAQQHPLSFFKMDRRKAGLHLIQDFLKTEWHYCNILQCLNQEYYKELRTMAEQGKFNMKVSEVDQIFDKIARFEKFHKVFYIDLNRGSDIGNMFVNLFNFFKGYLLYMKYLNDTVIEIMRGHATDKKLHDALTKIKENSTRKHDEMVDLMLVPLDRISDYKEFLQNLLLWADEEQEYSYKSLEHASRKMSRVAEFIDKYKFALSNRNEMNKVQTFVGKQCDILAAHRRIIRRGMMSRVSANGEKKKYVFFLFNDLLLWTTPGRVLKNLISLRDAEVLPSDDQDDPDLKFILKRGNRTINLECGSPSQREGWFNAVKDGLKAVAELEAEANVLYNTEGDSDEHKDGEAQADESADKAQTNDDQEDEMVSEMV